MRTCLDDYDQAAEILKAALELMEMSQIPAHEIPPVLADFALMLGVALLGSEGAEALMARMRDELAAVERGERGAEPQRRALRGRAPR